MQFPLVLTIQEGLQWTIKPWFLAYHCTYLYFNVDQDSNQCCLRHKKRHRVYCYF